MTATSAPRRDLPPGDPRPPDAGDRRRRHWARRAGEKEKDAASVQKLGQLHSFIAVLPHECVGQLASSGADLTLFSLQPLKQLVLSPAAAAKKASATAIFGLVITALGTVVIGISLGSALGATAGIIVALFIGVVCGGALAWYVAPGGRRRR